MEDHSLEPSVLFHLPSEPLRRYITAYYVVTVPPGFGPAEDLLHPEWANLRFTLSGHWSARLGGTEFDPAPSAALFGPTSRSGIVRGRAGVVLGVGLLPLGWARFAGQPAAPFADRLSPLGNLLGEAAETMLHALGQADGLVAQAALLDQLFERLDRVGPPLNPMLLAVHERLLNPAVDTVGALADSIDLSVRQLTRVSLAMFGFAPKLLIRRQRFLRTLQALIDQPERAMVAIIDEGYFDQSHFVRDFKAFMGMSPSRYFALPRPLLGPAGQARMQAMGIAYQGLHDKLR